MQRKLKQRNCACGGKSHSARNKIIRPRASNEHSHFCISFSLFFISISLPTLKTSARVESDTTLLSPGHRSTRETRQTIITSGGKQRCISPPSCTAHVVAKRHIYGPVGVIELWISGFGISSFTAPGCGRPPPSATITFLSAIRFIPPGTFAQTRIPPHLAFLLTRGGFVSLLTRMEISFLLTFHTPSGISCFMSADTKLFSSKLLTRK